MLAMDSKILYIACAGSQRMAGRSGCRVNTASKSACSRVRESLTTIMNDSSLACSQAAAQAGGPDTACSERSALW